MNEAERNLTSDLDAEVMPAPRRMPSIDFDEALAMFFVVLYHSHYYTTNFVEYGASAFPYYLLNGLLSTCVPMFFLVNGYLLFRKELNLRKHIIKTVRLTVVTIIWSFIIPVVLCPITGYEPTIKELLSWGWYRTMGWNDQLWFIGALVCIYIFFPILKVAYDKYRPAFLFFAAVCAIMTFGVVLLNQVISVALCGLFNRGSLFDFNYFASFDPFRGIHGYSFVYFCLGGLLWDKRGALLKRAPNKRVALAVATLVISSALLAAWGWARLQREREAVRHGLPRIRHGIRACQHSGAVRARALVPGQGQDSPPVHFGRVAEHPWNPLRPQHGSRDPQSAGRFQRSFDAALLEPDRERILRADHPVHLSGHRLHLEENPCPQTARVAKQGFGESTFQAERSKPPFAHKEQRARILEESPPFL